MIEKSVLTPLVERGMSQRKIATMLGFSQRKIRYWMDKHALKRSLLCTYCGRKGKQVCYDCRNQKYMLRWKKLKKEAVAYKGGKCQECGYNKFVGALDFHHRDPETKKYSWDGMKKRNWDARKKELDRCDLLCANCHREIEYMRW